MAAGPEISRSRSTGASAAWRALADHHRSMQGRHLRDLFADDPARGERMTAEAAGIFLDYSKNRVDDETLRLLVRNRDKKIPVDDTFSSGPGPPGQRNEGTYYAGMAKNCADDARQVLFISMAAGTVAVRPAYAAAGGNISVLHNADSMTFGVPHSRNDVIFAPTLWHPR